MLERVREANSPIDLGRLERGERVRLRLVLGTLKAAIGITTELVLVP